MFFCARGLQVYLPVALYSADKILPAMLLVIILLCLHRLVVFALQAPRRLGTQIPCTAGHWNCCSCSARRCACRSQAL